MLKSMPKINLQSLTGEALFYAKLIVRPDGTLRASRPSLKKGDDIRCAAYVWRMVAFSISCDPKHHCMPCTAYCYLPRGLSHDERRQLEKHLDGVADVIINSVPKSDWHGVTRWGNALGYIGTPRYGDDGAVIYR